MKKRYLFFCLLLTLLLLTACAPAVNYSDTQFCLNTACTIQAGGRDAKTAVSAAFDRILTIQRAADYYDPNSAVSAVNRAEAGVPVPVDRDTFSILQTAKTISEASGGAFSVTIAPVKDLWGFGGDSPHVPETAELTSALQFADDHLLVLDAQNQTVTKMKKEVKIDLGGAAKGYAADQALDVLRTYDITYAVLDLGGNVSVWGKNPDAIDGRWAVGIQKPFGTAGEFVDMHHLSEGSVVTSGTYQRNFTQEGNLYHHILDPKTGYPSHSGHDSATVISDSAVLADCLATACMILPEDEAKALAEQFHAELYFY